MKEEQEGEIRVLIVDDERLARVNLRGLLGEHPYVRIVGEARNIAEARQILDETPVDLIFLDIQMPGGSGFDLLEALERRPHVVFVTAPTTMSRRRRRHRPSISFSSPLILIALANPSKKALSYREG
jgi:DNA-binding LytR/AlgR family response regulator